jgi:hypothetical protein
VSHGFASRGNPVRHLVGYWSRDEIVAAVVANWENDTARRELEPAVRRATDALIAGHVREQATWPEVTDYDRLDAAFAELGGSGILARQNYEPTLTSGSAAIRAEVERERAGRPVRGFVYFHEQDTEVAVRCDGPVLAWGAVADADAAWTEVAQEIMAVLRRHGLKCSWPGQTNGRISIDGMRWQRRWSSRA